MMIRLISYKGINILIGWGVFWVLVSVFMGCNNGVRHIQSEKQLELGEAQKQITFDNLVLLPRLSGTYQYGVGGWGDASLFGGASLLEGYIGGAFRGYISSDTTVTSSVRYRYMWRDIPARESMKVLYFPATRRLVSINNRFTTLTDNETFYWGVDSVVAFGAGNRRGTGYLGWGGGGILGVRAADGTQLELVLVPFHHRHDLGWGLDSRFVEYIIANSQVSLVISF